MTLLVYGMAEARFVLRTFPPSYMSPPPSEIEIPVSPPLKSKRFGIRSAIASGSPASAAARPSRPYPGFDWFKQLSQASPTPSRSRSSWSELASSAQLSQTSPFPSASWSS